ncbi:MAG: GIY-YIG nuclease family protein [Gammaproteobacteria bacterium]|nr:GIY-YIG nuclease family protein [Gammaproteobacteria bacterium]
MESRPGTYSLLLALEAPIRVEVGSLGRIHFESPFYMYFGSAFGPGGLEARIKHHLRPVRRTHWHIDYLRQVARVVGVWYSIDSARFECDWASAASAFPGASLVTRFGSSDCRCQSHLVELHRPPSVSAFRRRLNSFRPGCAPIRQLQVPSADVV